MPCRTGAASRLVVAAGIVLAGPACGGRSSGGPTTGDQPADVIVTADAPVTIRTGKRSDDMQPSRKPADDRAGSIGTGCGCDCGGGGGFDEKRDTTVVLGPDAQVQGSLAREWVTRVFALKRNAFRYCWQTSGRTDGLNGELKVTLHLVIDARGKVTAATADGAQGALADCMVAKASALRFPAPTGPATVRYPVTFRFRSE